MPWGCCPVKQGLVEQVIDSLYSQGRVGSRRTADMEAHGPIGPIRNFVRVAPVSRSDK